MRWGRAAMWSVVLGAGAAPSICAHRQSSGYRFVDMRALGDFPFDLDRGAGAIPADRRRMDGMKVEFDGWMVIVDQRGPDVARLFIVPDQASLAGPPRPTCVEFRLGARRASEYFDVIRSRGTLRVRATPADAVHQDWLGLGPYNPAPAASSVFSLEVESMTPSDNSVPPPYPIPLPAAAAMTRTLACAGAARFLWALPGVARRYRGRRRRTAGLCPACGYDLRASPEKCPECGTRSPEPKSPSLAATQTGAPRPD